jgi:transposase InsO family protein
MEISMGSNTSFLTVERNTIKYMLGYVAAYEQVRKKEHKEYKTARALFAAKGICYQNFYKFYSRYISSGRDEQKLLPSRRGPRPKYKDLPLNDESIEKKVLDYRKLGYNKFVISAVLKKEQIAKSSISASTVYRILKQHGESRLHKKMVEEKRKIIREYRGSLGHVDCHILPKTIVTSEPGKRYYVLGCIDDYSRVVWVEVVNSLKALDICFAMMDIILIKHQKYDIKYEEILTDNGSEFCGGKDLMSHPFERLMIHFNIKHIRTKPYRPQTNGKIERFWRSFTDEVIEGAEYKTLEELKDSVLGYNFYYNENRPHQSLNGKTPEMMVTEVK